MPIATVTSLVETLRRNQLLSRPHMEELEQTVQARFTEPRALARELIQRDWLTPFQINLLFQDRGRELLLGSYLLLERIGEGGMGQVFKARNRKLEQIVALKVIRKERLGSPDVLRRFKREIMAAAQMSHPNVVRALDADEVGGTYFLAMEYVDGTDLGRLVKRHGPLPVPEACDYIRQAALGLQHAFERGLVHRDIKPSNLLLTTKGGVPSEFGTIKILDLGLALNQTGSGSSSTLTKEQMVMGTPDYISPEQARDAHAADIRSDLYSLGCTFYYLLAGRVPFPGETPMDKLLKHWCEMPQPLEQMRPEAPIELAAVMRKLMAKAPEDRYQTPAQLATVLKRVAMGHPAAVAVSALAGSRRDPLPTLALTPGIGGDRDETSGGNRRSIPTDPGLRGGAVETVEGADLRLDQSTPFEFNMEELVSAVESVPSLRTPKRKTDWKWIALNVSGGLLLVMLTLLFLLLLSR